MEKDSRRILLANPRKWSTVFVFLLAVGAAGLGVATEWGTQTPAYVDSMGGDPASLYETVLCTWPDLNSPVSVSGRFIPLEISVLSAVEKEPFTVYFENGGEEDFPDPGEPNLNLPLPPLPAQYTLGQLKQLNLPLSDDLLSYTLELCNKQRVDPLLALAVMERESRFHPNSISATNDYGLMQINAGNHAWLTKRLGVTDFLDPKQNILCGVYMLSLYRAKGYDNAYTLICYNAGPTKAAQLLQQGIHSTRYSQSVLEKMGKYQTVLRTANS